MRIAGCICIIGALLLNTPVQAEKSPEPVAMKASDETLSSVKKMKDALKAESSEQSNIVKETISWDAGSTAEEPRSNSLRMLQGLGLCVGLFLVGVAIARRINPRLRVVNEQRLSVRSRIPLTSKTQLILAEIDGREVLVAVGQENVALLQTMQAPKEVTVQKEAEREVRPVLLDGGKEFLCKEKLQHIV